MFVLPVKILLFGSTAVCSIASTYVEKEKKQLMGYDEMAQSIYICHP